MILLLLTGFIETRGYIHSTIMNEVALATPPLVYLAIRRDVLSSILKSLWNIKAEYVVPTALAVWAAGYFLTYLQDIFMPPPSWYIERMKSMAPTNLTELFLALLLTWLLVAPAEELLFRWVLLKPMADYLGVKMGVILSAFIFSSSHLDPWNVVSPFLVGLVAGLLIVGNKSILSAISLHAIHNTITISLLYFLSF